MEKITAVPVVRDANGWWCHPAMHSIEDELIPVSWFFDRGVQVVDRSIEMDIDEPDDTVMDGDCSAWDPTRPEGEGWFLLSIHDTEDNGPTALWARPLEVDEMYDAAVEFVRQTSDVSTAALQRHLRIGYNRAFRLLEMMETGGVVTKQDELAKRYLCPFEAPVAKATEGVDVE